MSSVFPMVPLSTVARSISRPVAVVPGHKYRTIGVRWWGGGAYERETIDGSQTAAKTLSIVRAGDLIINKIWVRHGSTAIAGPDVDGCAASNEFPTFELNANAVIPRWLHWFTKTRAFWEECAVLSRGTSGKNRIKPELFLTVKIPLPSIDEQQRVLSQIDDAACKIEEALKLHQEAEEEARAFVTSWHLELAGERLVRLADILELDEQQERVEPNREYPQVGVKSFGGGLFAKEAVGGAETTYKVFNRLYEGAVVMSQVKGWEGAVAVCPAFLAGRYVSPEYRTFRCVTGEAVPEYMAALVEIPWFGSLLKNTTRGVGARRERTRPDQFLALEVPMPNVEQQRKAALAFARLGLARQFQDDAGKELADLLPAILDKAFKGELL